MGWPRLQPLPEKFTFSSSMPCSRHAAIGTEANASLISHSATSPTDRPARCSTLPMTLTAPRPGVPGRHARSGPRLDRAHHVEVLGGGVIAVDEGDCRGGVVGATAIARRDRESLDLGVKHFECSEFLDGGVATRMLVDRKLSHRTVELRDLQRDDLVDELAASMAAMAR